MNIIDFACPKFSAWRNPVQGRTYLSPFIKQPTPTLSKFLEGLRRLDPYLTHQDTLKIEDGKRMWALDAITSHLDSRRRRYSIVEDSSHETHHFFDLAHTFGIASCTIHSILMIPFRTLTGLYVVINLGVFVVCCALFLRSR